MLEHANLFTVPLDDGRRWYRYHYLFADLLRRLFSLGLPLISVVCVEQGPESKQQQPQTPMHIIAFSGAQEENRPRG
jgi:hypothetical protein